MTKTQFVVLTGAITSLITAAAQADTPYIGVNFTGRNAGGNINANYDPIGAGTSAGLVPQTNFNNDTFSPGDTGIQTQTTGPLNSASGTATPVTLTVTAADSWNTGSGDASGDNTLLNGIVKAGTLDGGNNTAVFRLSNVPAGTYNFIGYTVENGGGAIIDGSLAGLTTSTIAGVQELDGGTQKAAPVNYTPATTTTPGNYIEFTNVSPDASGNLTFTLTHDSGSDGAGLGGFQLTSAVPEPSTWVAAGGLLLLAAGDFRRRLKA